MSHWRDDSRAQVQVTDINLGTVNRSQLLSGIQSLRLGEITWEVSGVTKGRLCVRPECSTRRRSEDEARSW